MRRRIRPVSRSRAASRRSRDSPRPPQTVCPSRSELRRCAGRRGHSPPAPSVRSGDSGRRSSAAPPVDHQGVPRFARVSSGSESRLVQARSRGTPVRSEEHTSELQSPYELVCRLLLEKKNNIKYLLFLVIKKKK